MCVRFTLFLRPTETLAPTPALLPADSFPFKWINKKWKEGFFGAWCGAVWWQA